MFAAQIKRRKPTVNLTLPWFNKYRQDILHGWVTKEAELTNGNSDLHNYRILKYKNVILINVDHVT